MRKIVTALLTAILISSMVIPESLAQATRTFNSPRNVRRKLALQFNGSTEVFTTTDPSPAGTPLTLSSATGISGYDGSVTLVFRAGFTAPATLTVYQWLQDTVNTSKSCWVRIAPSSTGTDVYSKAVDTNYSLIQFSIAERVPFLVMSDVAITGDVYTDAEAHPSNTGSTASGY